MGVSRIEGPSNDRNAIEIFHVMSYVLRGNFYFIRTLSNIFFSLLLDDLVFIC